MHTDSARSRKLARSLSGLLFLFMYVVSVVTYLTEEGLDKLDIILLLCGPLVIAGIGYFVGLKHDPKLPV